jgi:hypothetical protein
MLQWISTDYLNALLHVQVKHVPMQQAAAVAGAAGRAASVQRYKQHLSD